MSNTNPNWTKEELQTYLLIYCANADFSETKRERIFIKERSASEVYQKMHYEFEKDNDFASIEKITGAIEAQNLSLVEKDQLFSEIKELFKSDGETDILEENLFRGLQHLI